LANIKSAIKRIRVSERKRTQNKPIRTAAKTYVSKAEKSIAAGKPDDAAAAVGSAMSALDKAAEKGIIHRNNAARRKARLMKKYNSLATR
jgi:small subunit ribosomal protein S20